MTITAIGLVKDGKLTLTNERRFRQELKEFKDCAVELSIKVKDRRSNQQNAYYHGVVVKEIQLRLKELGNNFDAETVHDFLKDKFNKVEVVGPGAEVIDYVGGSTTKMNKIQFCEYIEKIAQWASETLGLYIPMPNEKLTLNF